MAVAETVGAFIGLPNPGGFLLGEGIACAKETNNGFNVGIGARSVGSGRRRFRSGSAGDGTSCFACEELITLVKAARGE
jgi:hypothetical protein